MTLPKTPAILACAVGLLALAPLGDRLQFRPTDGSESSKTFQVEGDFELGDFSMIVDGNDMAGMMPADFGGDFALSLSIVDHYLKTVDGFPFELARDCQSSSGEFSAAETSEAKDDVFGLDGETVVYKWNEEAKAYDRSFEDGEGDADKLESLGVDLDYRSLLPEREVEVGDTWAVEPKGLAAALFFGADLDQLAEGGEDVEPEMAEVIERILPEFERLLEAFKAQCEYAGTREEEGRQLAEIKIDIDSRGDADLASAILDVIEQQAQGQEVEFDLEKAALAVTLRGEGRLVWDQKAGRAHAFELQAEVELIFEIAMTVTEPGGTDHSAEGNVELLANVKWTMESGE
jgi:hypothetical protein